MDELKPPQADAPMVEITPPAEPKPREYNKHDMLVPNEHAVFNGHDRPVLMKMHTSDGELYLRNIRTGQITTAPKVKGKAARRAEKKARHAARKP